MSLTNQLYLLSKISFLTVILFFLSSVCFKSTKMDTNDKIISVDFEVFGLVQGVFFRKYTQQEAKKLGLKGWCRNTRDGTVQGVMEGPPDKVVEMRNWLQKTGSPQSRIEKAVFTNEHDIEKYSFDSFSIKR